MAVVDGDDRLIEDPEFVAGKRAPKVVFEAERRDDLAVHCVVEDCEAVAAHRFGPVHGGVGIAQEIFGALVLRVPQRNADADRGEDLGPAEIEGNPELFLDALGGHRSASDVLDVFDQDHEFVAPEPRHRISRAAGGFDPFGDRP